MEVCLVETYPLNPFLPLFYEDPERYGFTAQVSFLMERYRQQQDLRQVDLFQRATIADYIFAKDRIFAELNLDTDELALYDQIFDKLDIEVPIPDLVVYLQAPVDVLVDRIARRDIGYERFVDRNYLERLADVYESGR